MTRSRTLTGKHPRLVFRPGESGLLKHRADLDEGRAIVAQVRRLLDVEPADLTAGFHAAGWGLLHVLEPDAAHAERAHERVMTALDANAASAAQRSDVIVGVALAYDLCYFAWSEPVRVAVAAQLDERIYDVLTDDSGLGGRHSIGVRHATAASAAALGAMAVMRDTGAPRAEGLLQQAVDRVLEYQNYHGDRGWTQEAYPAFCEAMTRHILPFIASYRRLVDEDAFRAGPADAYGMLPLHLEPCGDPPPYGSGQFAMGMSLVPPGAQRAFLWLYEKRYGLAGDASFDIASPHHGLYALRDFPIGMSAQVPSPDLHAPWVDYAWQDERKGFFVCRSAWCDAHDAIVTIDLNAACVHGAIEPASAGAVTFTAGADWVCTRGPLEERSSYSAPGEDNSADAARLLSAAWRGRAGGTLEMDLRASCRAATRRVDIDFAAGAELGVTDQVVAGTAWRMHCVGACEPAERGATRWMLTQGDRRAEVEIEGLDYADIVIEPWVDADDRRGVTFTARPDQPSQIRFVCRVREAETNA